MSNFFLLQNILQHPQTRHLAEWNFFTLQVSENTSDVVFTFFRFSLKYLMSATEGKAEIIFLNSEPDQQDKKILVRQIQAELI